MKKGFAHLFIVIIIAVILIAGAFFFLGSQPGKTPALNNIIKKNASVDTRSTSSNFSREGVTLADSSLNNPEVIKLTDGTYRMFVHKQTQMLSAKSTDGKTFTLESGTRLNGGMPALVTLPDGRYRMYFNSFPENSIKSAVSSDG